MSVLHCVCFQVHGHTQFPLTVQWDITSIDGQKIATRTLQLSEMYRNAYNMQFIPALKNDSHYKRRSMNAFRQLTKTKKTTEYLLGETCEMSRISIEVDFGRLHE